MFCLYCGNKLPEDALFCNRCGTRRRKEEEVSTTGYIVQPAPPFPGTFIGSGQPSLGNVPMAQGTPRASAAPTVQGTPANLNTLPGGQALSHQMAPSSSSFSAPSQPPTHHPQPGHQGLRAGSQTLAGHVSRRAVITGLVGVTSVAVVGGLAVGVLSGKRERPFLPGSSTTPTHAPVLATSDSPMFGFDPQHTHFNPYEKVLNPTNVSRLVRDWTFQTGARVYSSPAVANGVVYVGSWDSNLYALDARSGSKLWAFQTGSGISSSPAVANGVVYVGSDERDLYAFHLPG